MGQMTNEASVGPSGTQWSGGDPNQKLKFLMNTQRQQFQEMAPQNQAGGSITPTGDSPVPNPVNGPMQTQMVKPSFMQAASVGETSPAGNVMSPGLTKAGKLMLMLKNGLQGALAGRAASEQAVVQSGGRRSGGVGMGMEAGAAYPWQQAQMGQQLQQEQAKTGLLQAQAKLAGTSIPVTLPNGQQIFIPASQIGQYTRGTVAAGVNEKAGLEKQALANQGAANVANIKSRYHTTANGLYDTQTQQMIPDTGGGIAITPEIAQQYGLPQEYVGRPMKLSDLASIERNQIAAAPKTTSGYTTGTDAQGNFVQLPTSHTTTPQVPRSVLTAPSGAAQGTAGGGPKVRPVTDAQGNPVKSSAGAAKGAKWVTWEENGRTVAGPMSMAQQRNAENPAELPAQEVRDVQNARHAVQLITKQGDPNKPETQGVLQLIDSLDKDGKLGVLASRYNSFLTTGVGASPDDDPRIITLINKNMLADTATMLSHFGASGGRSPQMLQHFLDLSNSRKMDGVTLRAGTRAIADYMQDRAMIPGEQAKPQKGAGIQIQRDANGRIIGVQ